MVATTLVEGKVRVGCGSKKFDLDPGMQLVYDRENKTANVRAVDTELYTSWKEDCTSKGWYVSNVSRLSVPFAALPALPHHPDLRTYVLYLSC